MRSDGIGGRWRWMLGILVLLSCRATAEPVNVGPMAMPTRAGFSFSLQMESVPGNGYQPLYLHFNPSGRVFTRQRNLTVEITALDQMQTLVDFVYRCNIQLPENGSGTRSIQYVPYYYPWERIHVQVFEDGRPLKGCDWTLPIGNTRLQPLELPSIGVMVSSNSGAPWQRCPDVRSLVAAFGGPLPKDHDVARLDHVTAQQLIQTVQPAKVQFRLLDVADLHTNWLGYSQLDAILIAAPLLQQLETQPAAYRAITDWLANGGNLWVYATEQGDSELLNRIALAAIPAWSVSTGSGLLQQLSLDDSNEGVYWEYNSYSGPQFLNASQIQRQYPAQQQQLTGGMQMGAPPTRRKVFDAAEESNHAVVRVDEPAEITTQIRQGRFGLGTVTAIDQEDPFPQSFQFWSAVLRSVGSDQLDWTKRSGIHVPAGNSRYWSLLIASVGQPPVKSFIALNTLFVLLIGPICYWYLQRRQRLYLLFFIAPAMALITTGGLVFYALVADGVRTRTRVRQLTWVDSQAGYVATQARHTYFAVLDSRKGLQFPADAAVYPVLQGSIRRGYRYQQREPQHTLGVITAAGDQTHFRGCFLPPRSQVQLMLSQPRKVDEQLQFSLAPEAVSVTNHFHFPIQQLTLCDRQGQVWQTNRIDPHETVAMTPAVRGQQAELGVQPLTATVQPQLRSTRDPWGRYTIGSNASLLEQTLENWLVRLPREHFLAVAVEPQQGLLGIEDADMTEQQHVLMGRVP